MERYIHSNFSMMLAGLIMWFLLVWSWGLNKKKWTGVKSFYANQKDEMAVALGFGMFFIIYDDQLLNALADALYAIGELLGMTVFKELKGAEIKMEPHYYFLVAPVIEMFYWLGKKFTK